MSEKDISRQGRLNRKKAVKGLCRCGNPRMIDPRFLRDLDIRSRLSRMETPASIAVRYGLSVRSIQLIAKRPAGKPKLLARCEACQAKHRNDQAHYRHTHTSMNSTSPSAA